MNAIDSVSSEPTRRSPLETIQISRDSSIFASAPSVFSGTNLADSTIGAINVNVGNSSEHIPVTHSVDHPPARKRVSMSGRSIALVILQIALGVFCAFKPAEPFVVPYLIENGFTMEQINQKIFPTSGYSGFTFLLILSMSSIGIPHQVLLYFGWIGYILCYTLLVFANNLLLATFVEIFYGLAIASETVYCAAFYFLESNSSSLVTKNLRASTISRTTLLITHVFSDLLGQLLISFIPGFPKRILFVITACTVTISVVPLIAISLITYGKNCRKDERNGDMKEPSSRSTARLTRRLYLQGLSYVWGGGLIHVIPLYVGIFSLSGHTLYQNYITNILYDVQAGTSDELYGLFVMAGRLSGVAGSFLALAFKKVQRTNVLLITLLAVLSFLFMPPIFINHLVWLFIANIIEFCIAELTATIMWAQLATACKLTLYPAVFLCQALIVSAIVLVMQATLFNNLGNTLFGFTANQTHYFWCLILGLLGTFISLIAALIARAKTRKTMEKDA